MHPLPLLSQVQKVAIAHREAPHYQGPRQIQGKPHCKDEAKRRGVKLEANQKDIGASESERWSSQWGWVEHWSWHSIISGVGVWGMKGIFPFDMCRVWNSPSFWIMYPFWHMSILLLLNGDSTHLVTVSISLKYPKKIFRCHKYCLIGSIIYLVKNDN